MLCPFCMLDYTFDIPCFCHAAVRPAIVAVAAEPVKIDEVRPVAGFNVAMLTHFDLGYAAPYLGA